MSDFAMPPASASFEERGGWLVNRFMIETDPELALGFTNIIHPAAIVGNLGGESGLKAINEIRPMVPGSRGGWGWAQWTGPRRVQFERFCADNGFDISSDEGQYRFLCWELLNTEKHSLLQLKKTTELEAAVYTFEVQFERPSDAQGGLPSRIKFAKRALAGASDTPPAPLPVPVVGGQAAATKDIQHALDVLIPELTKTLQAALSVLGQPKSAAKKPRRRTP